jgi:hypothetical protein
MHLTTLKEDTQTSIAPANGADHLMTVTSTISANGTLIRGARCATVAIAGAG